MLGWLIHQMVTLDSIQIRQMTIQNGATDQGELTPLLNGTEQKLKKRESSKGAEHMKRCTCDCA